MEPVMASMLVQTAKEVATPLAIVAASAINATVAYKNTTRNIKAQKERDERLAVLQERHRFEDKQFQLERDNENRRFQLEVEAQRMSFQEHLELRRLQFQVKMEQKREDFQMALAQRQQDFNREIAVFQAQAMRATQILVARENAQNMLSNQMIIEALKTFPLNISPMVLLGNRSQALSSLLRFTIGTNQSNESEEKGISKPQKQDDIKKLELLGVTPEDVLMDVKNYTEHPEALNIFIAPVFIDSKMPYQKLLSTKIWETTYLKIESFFTKNYSRDGKHPVMFYPTAWNDKYTSGVHASETLHYFLKDLPCIVLEPKFDGDKFRMAISFWGLGYGSTEHHRTECDFDIDIDLAIANSVYERSKNALAAIGLLMGADKIMEQDMRKYATLKEVFQKNISFYESLQIDGITNGTMSDTDICTRKRQIKALGIGNIFTLDYSSDLEMVADYLSSHIGMTLATLTDIHHLRSTDVFPVFPKLMKDYFPQLHQNEELRKLIAESYKLIFIDLRDEEKEKFMLPVEGRRTLANFRVQQIKKCYHDLCLELPNDTWQEQIIEIGKTYFNCANEDLEHVWETCLDEMTIKEKSIFELILPLIDDDKKRKQLGRKLDKMR